MPGGQADGDREERGIFVEGEEEKVMTKAQGCGSKQGFKFNKGLMAGQAIRPIDAVHVSASRRETGIARHCEEWIDDGTRHCQQWMIRRDMDLTKGLLIPERGGGGNLAIFFEDDKIAPCKPRWQGVGKDREKRTPRRDFIIKRAEPFFAHGVPRRNRVSICDAEASPYGTRRHAERGNLPSFGIRRKTGATAGQQCACGVIRADNSRDVKRQRLSLFALAHPFIALEKPASATCGLKTPQSSQIPDALALPSQPHTFYSACRASADMSACLRPHDRRHRVAFECLTCRIRR